MQGVAEAASDIAENLTNTGPWWTGSFSENWKIDGQPIRPTVPRTDNPEGEGFERFPAQRIQPKIRKLGEPTYIGNAVAYAGFVVNNPGATAPDGEARSYEEHINVNRRRSTVKGTPEIMNKARWFDVYRVHRAFLPLDIDKGFSKANFRVIKSRGDVFEI